MNSHGLFFSVLYGAKFTGQGNFLHFTSWFSCILVGAVRHTRSPGEMDLVALVGQFQMRWLDSWSIW